MGARTDWAAWILLDVCDQGVEDMSGVALRERLSTRGPRENVEDTEASPPLRVSLSPRASPPQRAAREYRPLPSGVMSGRLSGDTFRRLSPKDQALVYGTRRRSSGCSAASLISSGNSSPSSNLSAVRKRLGWFTDVWQHVTRRG
jgi:hypothetical protein